MSDRFELKVRLSFSGASRSLEETGRAMAAWTRAAAVVLAPELSWRTTSETSADHGGETRWGTSLTLELEGRDLEGARLGRARVRLAAGGDASTGAGSSLIALETVRPARYLEVDNHCDVTHWDLVAAPITMEQRDALRRALEDVVGRSAALGGEREEPLTVAAQLVASDASPGDAALWIEDLRSVGIESRGHTSDAGTSVFLERASIHDLDALEDARVVLGEVLSEAGHDDWHERTRGLLARLPSS